MVKNQQQITDEVEDIHQEEQSWFSRIMDIIFRRKRNVAADEGEDDQAPGPITGAQNLERHQGIYHHSINVRKAVLNAQDAKWVMSGLREGMTQIVDLNKTPSDHQIEVYYYLLGCCEMAGGHMEQVSDGVLLIAPSTVNVETPPNTSGATAGNVGVGIGE
jgi:FtsZ-interacting cell division protein YlmF